MLSFLNVVPDKLVGQKRYLLARELCVLRRRFNAYGVPLSAFAADNGFHRVSLGTTSAVPRIRLATLGLTNAVHDAGAVRDHCRHGHFHGRGHHRRLQIRYAELVVLLHLP